MKKGSLTHNSMLLSIAFSRRDKYESTVQTRVSGGSSFAVQKGKATMKKPPSWMNSALPADVTKHAIRVLRGFKRFTKPKPKRRGKSPVYQNEAIINPLKEIWLAANLPCSKRLKVILPIWLPGYVELSADVTQALLKISPPTIDRILKPIRFHYTKRGRSTTIIVYIYSWKSSLPLG